MLKKRGRVKGKGRIVVWAAESRPRAARDVPVKKKKVCDKEA